MNPETGQKTKRLNAKSVGLGGGLLVGTITALMFFAMAPQAKTQSTERGPGMLECIDPKTKVARVLPLEKTVVEADISGMAARVTVRQHFKNDSTVPIEAIYTFPLPADAAVDRMNMKVGDRVILGQIKKRDEAQRIYQQAKQQGKVASLLDQERPNIFTQSVANIMPGAKIEIEISYVQLLPFENGSYQFVYPMVVGPRYTGGTVDPDKVTPPVAPLGTRAGHTIELSVRLDAGMRIEDLRCEQHDVQIDRDGENKAMVRLADKKEIPNRDFVLNYQVAGRGVKSGLVTYADPNNGGFFTLILMPPKAPTPDQVAPKEVFFVMDQSGSQSGFPIAKSKQLTLELIETLGPNDTFNVLGFANTTYWLWPSPRPNTPENRAEAYRFVSAIDAGGGTELLKAVTEVYRPAPDPARRRLVVFNTDGYVGNDFEVLNAVQKNRGNSRMFTFGIGDSVNRFLIDSMSLEGKGDSEIVLLSSDADKAVERFVARTERPVLLDVNVTFEGVQVADVMPVHIPDVFADEPIVIRGRYLGAGGPGRIKVSGMLGGQTPWSQTVSAQFAGIEGNPGDLFTPLEASTEPEPATNGDILQGSTIATLWARGMVDEVMRRNWLEMVANRTTTEPQKQIESLGLRFGIMTQYTSFVAVEEKIVNRNGKSERVHVPVEMPDGVTMGQSKEEHESAKTQAPRSTFGYGGTTGGGGLGGAGGGPGAPASNAPVRRQKSGWASDSAASDWYDLKSMSDDGVATLSQSISPDQERALLAKQDAKQKARYLRLSRLDKKLRALNSGKAKVSIYFDPKVLDMKVHLSKAGVQFGTLNQGAGSAEGEIQVENLQKLAEVKGVLRVAMRSTK